MTLNYTIRKAIEQDKEELLNLGIRVINEYIRIYLDNDIIDEYLDSGAYEDDFLETYNTITVILLNEKIIGFMSTNKNEIQGFVIDIPYWGTGVAQYFLEYAERYIFKDYNEIYLECFENSHRANKFYLKEGFKQVAKNNGLGGILNKYIKFI